MKEINHEENGKPDNASEVTLDLSDSSSIFEPREGEYNPDRDREKVRGWLAQGLLILLFLVVLTAFLSIWAGAEFKNVKGILELTLTPLVGLTGAVTGFYFGGKEG